jgi:hypothetical protein
MTRPGTTFSHWAEKPNVGDYYCGPYRHFTLADEYEVLNYRRISELATDGLVVGGGLLVPTEAEAAALPSSKNCAWGIGTADTLLGPVFLERFGLVGVREYGHPQIDEKKVFYAPCPSCMDTLFDMEYANRSDVVLYYHANKTPPEVLEDFSGIPQMSNCESFTKAIGFLASADKVVTNSYHGTYWSLLLGKKTICVPFSTKKFSRFPAMPTYATWEDVWDKLKAVPSAIHPPLRLRCPPACRKKEKRGILCKSVRIHEPIGAENA